MGKNLKGKECGTGICQRKDGLYFARFYAKKLDDYDSTSDKWLDEKIKDDDGNEQVAREWIKDQAKYRPLQRRKLVVIQNTGIHFR